MQDLINKLKIINLNNFVIILCAGLAIARGGCPAHADAAARQGGLVKREGAAAAAPGDGTAAAGDEHAGAAATR